MPEPSPRIEGDGFALRRWRADDLDALVLHANDEAVSQGLRDRFPYPYTRADGEAFLSGRILPLDGPTLAIEVEGRACGGIAAPARAAANARTAPSWATGWAGRCGAAGS